MSSSPFIIVALDGGAASGKSSSSRSLAERFNLLHVDTGSFYRHITYDERARGKSRRSADYSFEGMIRDLDAVLKARGVDRPLLVGWSYGAFVAAHWVSRHPQRSLGAVLVDGAQPYDWLTDAMHAGDRLAITVVDQRDRRVTGEPGRAGEEG